MYKFKNKIKLYLGLIILLFVLIIFFSIMLFLNINNGILSVLYGVGALGAFIIMFIFKNNYDYQMNLYRYQELLNSASKPVSLLYKVSENEIMNRLKQNNYKSFTKGDNYASFYKLDNGIINHKRHRTLYIAVILLNNSKNFSDPKNNDYFEEVEKNLYKKEKYIQRVFYQVKIVNNFTEKNIIDTNKIFFVSAKREHIIVQNLLFNTNKNSLYFLHSKSKFPNKYFIHSNKLINDMFIK